MEKFKHEQKSPEEIAEYMAERLRRENAGKAETIKEKIDPEEGALELIDLTLEKEDLLKAISSDEKLKSKEQGAEEDKEFSRLRFGRGVYFNQKEFAVKSIEGHEKELGGIEKKIGSLSADKNILEKYKEIMSGKIEIIKMAREVEKKKAETEKNDFEKNFKLAHRNNDDLKLTKSDREFIKELDAQNTGLEKEIGELMSSPEVYYEANRRELLDYRRQLFKGGIVETPSVKAEINQILSHLELSIPVFLRGHLGAGKTEILLHISRKYYGVEPEFISGSEEASKYDIYGKTQIGVRSEENKISEFKMRMDEYKEMNPEAGKKELKDAEKQYYNEIVVKGQTSSFFQYGPLVRAMEEGKPLVIDEMDGIPHSILMRLNHILTRKAGDKVKIQENGGEEIEIKPGFCVMATGNIKSAKYEREELDAAFLSRWWSSEVKYLPQNETLKIILASLVDKRGYLQTENNENLDSTIKLTKSAEEIQKIFTGEKIDVFGEGGDAARGSGASLEKSVLSMRDMWNIVKPWKAKNFDKPLDDYIYTEFIKKATVPKDAIYLTQLFCRFGFFKDWEAEKFGIAGLDKKKLEAFKAKKTK